MRGMLSYAMMLIVNPILILFYQNCSVIPKAPENLASPPALSDRAPASAPSAAPHVSGSCSAEDGRCAMNVESLRH